MGLGPWTPVRVPKAAPNSCHQPGPAWPLWSFGKETSRQKTFLCSLALFLCNSAFKVNKWTFYPIKNLASYNNSVDKPTHPQSLDETKYGSTHLHKYLLCIITVGSGLEIESNLGGQHCCVAGSDIAYPISTSWSPKCSIFNSAPTNVPGKQHKMAHIFGPILLTWVICSALLALAWPTLSYYSHCRQKREGLFLHLLSHPCTLSTLHFKSILIKGKKSDLGRTIMPQLKNLSFRWPITKELKSSTTSNILSRFNK